METNNQELVHQLFQMTWMLRRFMEHHRGRGPMGQPFQGQGRILALLKLKPEISQKELSTILDIRSQSLGELLGKLEKAGFITRTTSETDRRAVDIKLTEAGMAQAEKAVEPDPSESFFDCLNDDEKETFSGYLDRLIKSLEAQIGDQGPDEERGRGPGFRGHRLDFHGDHHGDHFHGHFERSHGHR